MKFFVIGSVDGIEKLQHAEGFTGGAGVSVSEFRDRLLPVWQGIDVLLIELTPAYIRVAAEQNLLSAGPKAIYFEITPSGIELNGGLAGAFQDIMGHYYKVHTQTQGQIGYLDAAAITLTSLKHIRDSGLTEVRALEVGSWTGCSSFFLAKTINSLGANGVLCCLDTWQGNDYWNYDVAAYIDIFAIFRGYMRCCGTYRHIVPIVADSSTGFGMLRDDFYDIVFIDGDHRYSGAYSDIRNAMGKLRPGGLLIGHDGCAYADELPAEFLAANLDKDCAFYQGRQYSCGVLKALQELFGRSYAIFDGCSTWWKTVSAKEKAAAASAR